ncbi:MAG: hypothetical protein IPM33_00025 [Phycisphaerales bacterium]|nr:hypothetical protein [Phycisphaerales bacterium]
MLLEVRLQGLEALLEALVQDGVVADRVLASVLVEGVSPLAVHPEVRAEQVDRAEAQVVQQVQRGEHDRALAFDAKGIGVLAVLAPVDRVALEEPAVVEVVAAAVEEHAGHLSHLERAGAERAVGVLDAKALVEVRDGNDLQDARVLPAGVDEAAGVIHAGPQRGAMHGPGVVDGHRDDAAPVELRKVQRGQRRTRQDQEGRAPTIEVTKRDGVEVGGVEAHAAPRRPALLQPRLQRRDISAVVTHG